MPSTPADALHAAIRLRATISTLTRRLRTQATNDSPGSAKLSALGQLYRQGPLTPTQLAFQEGVKVQSLTRLLAELERDGYAARRPHDSDARQCLLSLTTHGARLLADEVHRREASLASAMDAQLSAHERAQLLSACDLIDRLAGALCTDRACPPARQQPKRRGATAKGRPS